MTNTPQIGSTANRGSTSERPRKNNKSDNHHEILTFLDRFDRNMTIGDMVFHIGDIRHQIATEENSFLNHSVAVCEGKREVRSKVACLEQDGVSDEEIVEHPDFLYASGDLDKDEGSREWS